MNRLSQSRLPWFVLLIVILGSLTIAQVDDPGPSTPNERARALGESIKCPTCQGQSVSESDSPAARAIRTEIVRQIDDGRTDDEIRDFLALRYGDDVVLTPPRDGITALVWFLPVALFVGAIGGLIAVFRRWRNEVGAHASDADRVLVERRLRSSHDVDAS